MGYTLYLNYKIFTVYSSEKEEQQPLLAEACSSLTQKVKSEMVERKTTEVNQQIWAVQSGGGTLRVQYIWY